MDLSSQTVDALFRRLFVRYGASWTAKWNGIPEADIRADWARVLGHVPTDALKYGLEYLPDFVPTAHQFREMCGRAPEKKLAQLPPPKPTEEDKARIRAMLQSLKQKIAMQRVA